MLADGKSFLQVIKLEISRSFKLTTYERFAFHKILGLLRSESGIQILMGELKKTPEIRESAVATLVQYVDPQIAQVLSPLLDQNVSYSEKIDILKLIRKLKAPDYTNLIKICIEKELKQEKPSEHFLSIAFNTLKEVAIENEEILIFIKEIIGNLDFAENIRSLAAMVLASSRDIHFLEELLDKDEEFITYGVYKALYDLNNRIVDAQSQEAVRDERLYTYTLDHEDEILLNIRVLIGKKTPRFDEYSNRVKTAFLSLMMSCNHREMLTYIMKALTSEQSDIVRQTLYAVFNNIRRIREPDKLLKNLISLTTVNERDNRLIADIFERYFAQNKDTRQFHILQDKMYSYIVVTLETYFEAYRKEFIVADVIEKSFPESFQHVRNFILEKCNPSLKKKITQFLLHEDSATIDHIITDMASGIAHIDVNQKEELDILFQLLLDEDKKSRANSVNRIESINFEKRFLRYRIIRLCSIIGRLKINDASSLLVNIYNFIKKYHDPAIMDVTIRILSTLNYSYMLGEIEIMLNSGVEEEQERALQLVSLFNEPRSLNILFEFIGVIFSDDSPLLQLALSILHERDIRGNATAEHLFKKIIENNSNQEIVNLAILGIGMCGQESDIDYLNDLFHKQEAQAAKESIIRAVEQIISQITVSSRRQVIKYLQEYLKDAGIRVRIYSCLLLVRLGHQEALKSIRDMLVIKNKDIQREILTILGDLQSLEFSFFLISLLKEEYGISGDILPILKKTSEEDLKEIDSFIVNMFRKNEAPSAMGQEGEPSDGEALQATAKIDKAIMFISILDPVQISTHELITLQLNIKQYVSDVILAKGGNITKSSYRDVVAYFDTAAKAGDSALEITQNIRSFNKTRRPEQRIKLGVKIDSFPVHILNDEIIDIDYRGYEIYTHEPLRNRIVIDEGTFKSLNNQFYSDLVPESILTNSISLAEHFELLSASNFIQSAEQIVAEYFSHTEQKRLEEKQMEQEMKKLRLQERSKSSVAIASDLENIGEKLRKQLEEIELYVQRRSTDRELLRSVRTMLNNAYNLYKVEISRIVIK